MMQLRKQQSNMDTIGTWAASANPAVKAEAAKIFLNCENNERQFQIFEVLAQAAPDFAEEQVLNLKSASSQIDILTKAYKDGDSNLTQVANHILAKCKWDAELVSLCLASKTKEIVLAASTYFSTIALPDTLSEQPNPATSDRPVQVFNQLTNSDKRAVLARLMLIDETREKKFVRGLLATLPADYAISLVVFSLNDTIQGAAATDDRLAARNSALEATNSELRKRVYELESSAETRIAA